MHVIRTEDLYTDLHRYFVKTGNKRAFLKFWLLFYTFTFPNTRLPFPILRVTRGFVARKATSQFTRALVCVCRCMYV